MSVCVCVCVCVSECSSNQSHDCRVSYCTVDPYYDKVFCYISRNHETKLLECHAFLCSKKSKVHCYIIYIYIVPATLDRHIRV